MSDATVIPMEDGFSGKAEILRKEVILVINSGRYDEMTIAEIAGVMFGIAVQYSK